MTDLEITKLCAKAMGIELRSDYAQQSGACAIEDGRGDSPPFTWYMPLHDDAQAMALVKKCNLSIGCQSNPDTGLNWVSSDGICIEYGGRWNGKDLNRAICECVAKLEKARHEKA